MTDSLKTVSDFFENDKIIFGKFCLSDIYWGRDKENRKERATMRKEGKRVLAWLLAAFMLISSVDPVYAADDIAVVQPTEEAGSEHTHTHAAVPVTASFDNEAGTTAYQIQLGGGNECYLRGDLNGDGYVNSRDAIYLFGHTIDEDSYPIDNNQDCDYVNDEKLDNKDVFYLLGATFNFENTGINIPVHVYGEPVWSWKEVDGQLTAEATFICACKKTEYTKRIQATVETNTEPATCTKEGKETITATVSFGGKDFRDVKENAISVLPHSFGENTKKCDEDQTCSVCGYVEKAIGHVYKIVEEKTKEASCTQEGSETYACECGAEYTVKTADKLAHTPGTEKTTEKYGNVSCQYVDKTTCTKCGQEVVSEPYIKHVYGNAVITKEATCTTPGEKKSTCSCGDEKREAIPVNENSHVWNEGVKAEGFITYTCTECSATKTAVDYTDATSAAVAADVIESASGEVALKTASIKIDEATQQLLKDKLENQENKEISIGVTDATLNEEQAANVPEGSKVYEFSLKSGDASVTSFGEGKLTISLPYVLGEDEDPDSIDVWYVKDNGEVSSMKGTYSNGWVTFETDHFSIFSIIKLTLDEICKYKGHNEEKIEIHPTCEKAGMELYICKRCGNENTSKRQVIDALGHNYGENGPEVVSDASCDTPGEVKYTCVNPGCKHSYTSPTSALGHSWVVDSDVAATCTQDGKKVSHCDRKGCGKEKTESIPKTGHAYSKKETIAATCTEDGYTVYACTNPGCTDSYKDDIQPALGHSYDVDNAKWVWNEKTYSAKVTLSCKNCSNSIERDAAIGVAGSYATCDTAGELTYTAKVSYNGVELSDSRVRKLEAKGHVASEKYISDWDGHAFACANCGEMVDKTPHVWKKNAETDEEYEVVKENTCIQDGLAKYVCEVCGADFEQILEKTGNHKFDSRGNCTLCGFRKNTCAHNSFHAEYPAAEGLPEGLQLIIYICDCGKVISDTELLGATDADISTTYTKDADSALVTVDTTTYGNTGLVKKTETKTVNDAECASKILFTDSYFLNDKPLQVLNEKNEKVDAVYSGSIATEDHTPSLVNKNTTILSSNGDCKVEYYELICACGECTGLLEIQDTHNWIWEEEEEGKSTDICAICHDRRRRTYTETEGAYSETVEFMSYDSDVAYKTFTTGGNFAEYQHSYAYNYELLGDDCQDGIMEYIQCTDADCGVRIVNRLVPEYDIFPDMVEQYDLNQYGCNVVVTKHTCVCGKNSWFDYDAPDCEFEEQTYDSVTRETIEKCNKCGFEIRTKWLSDMPEDFKHGEYMSTVRHTYKDGKGNTLLKLEGNFRNEKHSYSDSLKMKDTEAFLLGDDCLDGVLLTTTCTDCGKKDSWISRNDSWHVSAIAEEIDLSKEVGAPITLIVNKCFCGLETWIHDECDWMWNDYDSEKQCDIFYCEEHDVYKTEKREYYGEKDKENCYQDYKLTISYQDQNGNELASRSFEARGANHRMENTTYELLGTSCFDGFEGTSVCSDCGYVETWINLQPDWHPEILVEEVELACGGYIRQYTCLCGETGYISIEDWECEYQWEPSSEQDGYTIHKGTCMECGATKENWEKDLTQKDENCEFRRAMKTVYTLPDGKEYRQYSEFISSQHDLAWPTSVELKGESCEDGVTYEATCQDCGKKIKETISYHASFGKKSYDLSQYGFCQSTLVERECLCGEYNHISSEKSVCDFVHISGEGDGNGTFTEKYECSKCHGMVTRTTKELIHEGCIRPALVTVEFTGAEGKSFSFTRDSVNNNHKYCVQGDFVCNGESCEDGWSVKLLCSECGYENTEMGTEHRAYCISRVDLSETGICGTQSVEKYSCSCGQNSWSGQNNNGSGSCDWMFYYRATDTDAIREIQYKPIATNTNASVSKPTTATNTNASQATNTNASKATNTNANRADVVKNITPELFEGLHGEVDAYICRVCAGYRYIIKGDEPIKEDDCHRIYDVDLVVVGAKGAAKAKSTWDYPDHNYKSSYEFLGEKNCLSGVKVTQTCTKCEDKYDYIANYHINEVVEEQKVPGSCEMVIRKMECPCGYISNYNVQDYCNWGNYESDGEWGIYTCSKCGIKKKTKYDRTYDVENCMEIYTTDFEVESRDGKVLGGYSYSRTYPSHTYTFAGEVGGISEEECKAYHVTDLKCLVCGATSKSFNSWHCRYTLEKKKVGCSADGYIEFSSCECGKETYISDYSGCSWERLSTEKTESGWIYTYQCKECKARYTREERNGEKIGCEIPIEYVYTYQYGDDSFTYVVNGGQRVEHDYEKSYEFLGENEDCREGVKIISTCKECGYSYESTQYSHYSIATEITEFPDSCNLVLTKYECPCGRNWYNSIGGTCEWEWSSEENGGKYTCKTCGYVRLDQSSRQYDKENCVDVEQWTGYIYNKQGELVKTYKNMPNTYEHHDWMLEEKLGDDTVSCDEGQKVLLRCQVCDKTEERAQTWHETFTIVRKSLSDLGVGHKEDAYVEFRDCSCGSYYPLIDESGCSWDCISSKVGDNASTETFKCTECEATYTIERTTHKKENCVVTTEYKYTLCYDGVDPIVLSYTQKTPNHEYMMAETDAVVTEEQCEMGVQVNLTCVDCYKEETRMYGSHSTILKEKYDLASKNLGHSEDACIKYYSCACGKEGSILDNSGCRWTCKDNEQQQEGVIVYECTDESCKTEKTATRVFDRIEGCTTYYRETDTYSYEGQEPVSFVITYGYNNHECTYTWDFPGEENCTAGVHVVQKCKNCDYSWERNEYYHLTIDSQEIEIPGSSCGMFLMLDSCPCGKEKSYTISSDCEWSGEPIYEDSSNAIRFSCSKCGYYYIEKTEYVEDEVSGIGTWKKHLKIYNNNNELIKEVI